MKCGWGGIVIEPSPEIYNSLTKNRSCTKLNCCVSSVARKEKIRVITGYPEMLSGLVENYHPRYLERIENEIREKGGGFEDIEINCVTLNSILENDHIYDIGYISIDIEGGEYEILKSFDFNKFRVSIFSVENNYKDYRISKLMKKKGYFLLAILGDEFYIK